MSKKKTYDDDDGRVIADMSDVSCQPLIIPRFDHLHKDTDAENKNDEERSQSKPYDDVQMSRGERSALIGGALGAGLAVGAVFIGIIGLVIFLIAKFGG